MDRILKGNLAAVGLTTLLAVAGCGGSDTTGGGIFNLPAPRLRVVNGLPQVAAADAKISGPNTAPQPVATNIGYATVSGTSQEPYDILDQRGMQTVAFADHNNPLTTIATFDHGYVYGDKVTVIAYGTNASPQTVVVFDDTSNAQFGSDIRIVDAAAQTGAVDVFVTPPGAAKQNPVLLTPSQVFPAQQGSTPGYELLATAGAYEISVYPQGHDTGTPLLQQTVQVHDKDRLTFVVLDPPTGQTSPKLLVVQDNNSNGG